MKRLAVIVALGACGNDREAPAPKPRTAEVTQPRVTPALPPKSEVPGLAEDLKDPDPKVRRAAAREATDATALLAASRDPDREVAITATEALGKLHARGDVPVDEMIARATDRSLDERVRVSALNGLGLVASADAAKTLVELVRRGDTVEKRSAAILLVHQDPDVAIPALIDALADADEVVRANALEALKARARGRDFGSDSNAWRSWWQSRSR
jgi:HEAT repeat protein